MKIILDIEEEKLLETHQNKMKEMYSILESGGIGLKDKIEEINDIWEKYTRLALRSKK